MAMAPDSPSEELVSSAPNDGDSLDSAALGDKDIVAAEVEDDDPHNPYLSFRRVEAVNVSVRNVGISVVQKPTVSRLWKWKKSDGEEGTQEIKILDNISADMPAGQVMAIIGGSGSGKVRQSYCLRTGVLRLTRADFLLNAMAHRMRGQNLSNNRIDNFQRVSKLVEHSPCVCDAARCTVAPVDSSRNPSVFRRTAPAIRHPAEERERVVEEVILQLGLKECADTPIGDGAHKGCSGGEKRRVSIGVQLLAKSVSLVFR
ncbi:hypothetical protein FN846DRAFT_994230 [Sphaerosporella brunnea]|uniref:ABC transporter domain-containing protein n=1 Tax=Sphaerosporella brunnea TaxID=1250544 RepID=A0A5J5EL98_9PEZI|nr:hypothetical protein FN846DRAFT_994230 [Sphaerosporella brunnea]